LAEKNVEHWPPFPEKNLSILSGKILWFSSRGKFLKDIEGWKILGMKMLDSRENILLKFTCHSVTSVHHWRQSDQMSL
jgi:hypothetical protein